MKLNAVEKLYFEKKMSIASRINGRIGWMVKKLYLKGSKSFISIKLKLGHHLEYCTQASALTWRHGV